MMRSSEEVLVTVAGDKLLGREYANGMAGVGDAFWASNNGEKGGRSGEGERDEMREECADALDTSRSLRLSAVILGFHVPAVAATLWALPLCPYCHLLGVAKTLLTPSLSHGQLFPKIHPAVLPLSSTQHILHQCHRHGMCGWKTPTSCRTTKDWRICTLNFEHYAAYAEASCAFACPVLTLSLLGHLGHLR